MFWNNQENFCPKLNSFLDMLNNIYVSIYMCARIDICIYLYIYSSTHLYMAYIYMNKQDTDDRLCSFKEMKKQISFYLFSTRGFPGSKLTGKQTEKKALDQMFRIRQGSPNPGWFSNYFFPRGKTLRKLCSIFRRKKKKRRRRERKKNKKVRVRSVNFVIMVCPGFGEI